MQENGWTFYRRTPALLEAWKIIIGALLFICFIVGIVLRLRRKTEAAGSLRLDRSDSQRHD
jgi:hypothetical protein